MQGIMQELPAGATVRQIDPPTETTAVEEFVILAPEGRLVGRFVLYGPDAPILRSARSPRLEVVR